MCREKHRKSSSWLGNSVRWFVVYEHVNTYTIESFVGLCTHSNVWKCLVWIEESVQAHSPVCSTLLRQCFLWCGEVGGCTYSPLFWSNYSSPSHNYSSPSPRHSFSLSLWFFVLFCFPKTDSKRSFSLYVVDVLEIAPIPPTETKIRYL